MISGPDVLARSPNVPMQLNSARPSERSTAVPRTEAPALLQDPGLDRYVTGLARIEVVSRDGHRVGAAERGAQRAGDDGQEVPAVRVGRNVPARSYGTRPEGPFPRGVGITRRDVEFGHLSRRPEYQCWVVKVPGHWSTPPIHDSAGRQ